MACVTIRRLLAAAVCLAALALPAEAGAASDAKGSAFDPGLPDAGFSTLAIVPSGFQESVAFSGLTNPTAVRFAPDGRVFVAEKGGLIKVFDGLGTRPRPSSPTSAPTCTTSGTAACSAWRSTRSSPRAGRTSTSSTPTTPRSAGRRAAGVTPAPRRRGPRPTAASSAAGSRGSSATATRRGPSRC